VNDLLFSSLLRLNTHRELFQSLKRVVDNGDIVETTAIDDHVSKLFLFDFEQCGIHLEENLRRKVVHLNETILQLGQRFMSGAVHPRSIPKTVLPENIRHMFSIDPQGDDILVSGLYADSPNALAREAAYRLYLYPDSHQEELLSELIRARHELATICGFPSYGKKKTCEKKNSLTFSGFDVSSTSRVKSLNCRETRNGGSVSRYSK
jgi:mitochondrial intermediate peptidase